MRVECAQRLGIESFYLPSQPWEPEVTLLELVGPSAPGQQGRKVEPWHNKDYDAQSILLENKQLRQVADSGAAYIITDVLQDVLEPKRPPISVEGNRPAAGKTAFRITAMPGLPAIPQCWRPSGWA